MPKIYSESYYLYSSISAYYLKKGGLIIVCCAAKQYGTKFITARETAGYTNGDHEKNGHKETNNSALQQVCTM